MGLSERTNEPNAETEATKEAWYNSALMIDDTGVFCACYRKVHLWGAYERQFFTPGDDLQRGVFEFHGVRCGILICFDVEFPESVRTLAFGPSNSEVVFVPTALVNAFNANVTVPSRAFENGCIVCYANEVGADPRLPATFCGRSVVALPDGSEAVRLSSSNEQQHHDDCSAVGLRFSLVDLDSFAEARERNNYRLCRRPEAYLVQ